MKILHFDLCESLAIDQARELWHGDNVKFSIHSTITPLIGDTWMTEVAD